MGPILIIIAIILGASLYQGYTNFVSQENATSKHFSQSNRKRESM